MDFLAKEIFGCEKTDLNDNIVRRIGVENGLVDVKVAAIDETWSGLKFVFRIEDRKIEVLSH